jgi:peptidoglycan/LPS O-acetylase OafA/YrhL
LHTDLLKSTHAGKAYWLKVHGFSLFFAVLVFFSTYAPSGVISNRVTRFLGELSYGIYLIHPPVIVLAIKPIFLPHLTKLASGDAGLIFILCALTTMTITIFLAWIAFHVVEKPSIVFGNRLAGQVGISSSV